MKKKDKEKSPINWGSILIRAAAVMLILTIISVYLLSGVLARYASRSTGGDTARVVRFGDLTLTEGGTFDEVDLVVPGVDLTKDVKVYFDGSEAAVAVFVELIMSDDWTRTEREFRYDTDAKLRWSVTSGWDFLKQDTYDGKTRCIYYRVLVPNKELNGEPVIADGGAIIVSEEITAAEIENVTDAKFVVRAAVIQLGGFATIDEAWAKLDR